MITRLLKSKKRLSFSCLQNFSTQTQTNEALIYELFKQDVKNEFAIKQKQVNFVNLLSNLITKDAKNKREVTKFVQNLTYIPFDSVSPVRDSLEYYRVLTAENGFEPNRTAFAVNILGKTIAARRPERTIFSDVTDNELINNWRFYNLFEDLKHGLLPQTFNFTLHHTATAINGLVKAEIKSNEVIDMACNKIKFLFNLPHDSWERENPVDLPGAGKYGFFDKNESARDLFKDEHYNALLRSFINEPQINIHGNQIQVQILKLQQEMANYAFETKNTAMELVSSIDAIIEQYAQLENAIKINPELIEIDFVKYELFKLQDLMTKHGFLDVNAREALANKIVTEEEIEEIKKSNVQNVIREYAFNAFPQLFSKASVEIMKTAELDDEIKDFSVTSKRGIGKLLRSLAQYAKLETKDIKLKEYYNYKISPKEKVKDTRGNVHDVHEHDYFEKRSVSHEFTIAFDLVRETFEAVNDNLLKEIAGGKFIQSNLELMQLFGALVEFNFTNANLSNFILKKLEKENLSRLSTEDLAQFLVDLAYSGYKSLHLVDSLVQILFRRQDMQANSFSNFVRAFAQLKNPNNEAFVDFVILNAEKVDDIDDKLLKTNLKRKLTKDNLEIFPRYMTERVIEQKETQRHPLREMLKKSISESFYPPNYTRKSSAFAVLGNFQKLLEEFIRQPDLLVGIYGKKYGIYLLDTQEASVNLHKPTVEITSNAEFIKEKYGIAPIFVSIHDALKFDPLTLDVTIKNLTPLDTNRKSKATEAVRSTSNFSSILISEIISLTDKYPQIVKFDTNLSNFITSLHNISQNLLNIVYSFSVSEMNKAILTCTSNLNTLAALQEQLTAEVKDKLNESLAEKGTLSMVSLINSNLEAFSKISMEEKSTKTAGFDWKGKRFGFDIIETNETKDLSVEFINHNFMLQNNYCPYEDWNNLLKENYDLFNYSNLNTSLDFKFNNTQFNYRNLPKGIFPHPTNLTKLNKLNVNLNPNNQYEEALLRHKYKKELMLSEETQRNRILASRPIPKEISMIVNILNIVQGIKSTIKNENLFSFLGNLNLVDLLLTDLTDKSPIFLPRNALSFTNFLKSANDTIEPYDQFSKFIVKEKQRVDEFLNISDDLKLEVLSDNYKDNEASKEFLAKYKKHMEQTENADALSIFPPGKESWILKDDKAKRQFDFAMVDSDVRDVNRYNEAFSLLNLKRVKAERNLIIMRIINKIRRSENLSVPEINYVKKLRKELSTLSENQTATAGLNAIPTMLSIASLSGSDLKTFNNFDQVDSSPELNHFALSDLVLELGHLIDTQAVEQFLMVLKNSNLEETSIKYKENYLLMLEYKEQLWRRSGEINHKDLETIKNFFRVKRGKSYFDEVWMQLDEKSLEEFISDVNPCEDRFKALEEWWMKKEEEMNSRVDFPREKFRLSDGQLRKMFEKRDRQFREKLLCKMFNVGDSKEIGKASINAFIEKLIAKLPSFDFVYPSVLIDIFDSIEDLESLTETQRNRLRVFRDTFEVDQLEQQTLVSEVPVVPKGDRNFAGEKDQYLRNFKRRLSTANQPVIKPLVDELNKI